MERKSRKIYEGGHESSIIAYVDNPGLLVLHFEK